MLLSCHVCCLVYSYSQVLQLLSPSGITQCMKDTIPKRTVEMSRPPVDSKLQRMSDVEGTRTDDVCLGEQMVQVTGSVCHHLQLLLILQLCLGRGSGPQRVTLKTIHRLRQ